MKFFRSHIARLSGFLLLMLGIMLHHAKPTENKSGHAAFTNWLGSHLKTNNDGVIDQIDALNTQDGELEAVIRKASELVYDHADEFKIPGSDTDSSTEEDVYQLLLTEWNNFRNSGNGMGKAVLVENIKPQTVLPGDGYSFASTTAKTQPDVDTYRYKVSTAPDYTSSEQYTLSPLKSGTAIGAP